MVKEVGTAFLDYALVTHASPGPEQAPNPTYFCKWNVETPYRSLLGQQTPRSAHGGAGTGLRTKRMPPINRADRSCNITPGVFKSWGYSGSHALELLEKSSYVLWDWLF